MTHLERDSKKFTVETRTDDRVMFTQGLMSAEGPERVKVSQSINGAWLFLTYGGQRYSVSVEKLAVSWLEAIRNGE